MEKIVCDDCLVGMKKIPDNRVETNQEYINIAEACLSAYPKQKLLGEI